MSLSPQDYLTELLALPGLSSPMLSPDGKWVAWSWFRVGPAADVWVDPTDGSTAPLQLCATPEPTMMTGWTPDSRGVLVKEDHDGDEREQIFRIDLDKPGEMVPLTGRPPCFVRGGQLHPDGKTLFYGANWDSEAKTIIEPTWVYRHDIETGLRTPIARPLRGCFNVPRLNSTGTHVIYLRNDRHPAGREIWLVGVDGTGDRCIISAGETRRVSATWHPDGQRVIFVAACDGYRRLGVYDITSEQTRWLIDDRSRNIEGAFVPRGSEHAVVLEIREARTRAFFLDLDTLNEHHLPDIAGNLTPLGPVGGGEWVGVFESSRQPGDVVRFHPHHTDPAHMASLTRVWERTHLRPDDLVGAEDFRWHSVDGLLIQGWLYLTPHEVKGTVIHIHGGPSAHSTDRLSTQIQYLLSQGFNVLDPNYRGSTGFSLAFQDKIKEDGWGGREQDDIRAGIAALMKEGFASPGRVAVTGTSYGGYSSWCLITRCDPAEVAASAPCCGMTDLVVDYETTRPDLRPLSEEMMGGRPDEVPERYRERSPIHFVDQIRGGLLIIQGSKDPNVTQENVRAVEEALQKSSIPYETAIFDDEGHGIGRPHNMKTLYPQMVDFFLRSFDRAAASAQV